MEELWDIARVAVYLGVTERTVYNKVRAGDLPAIRIGRLWRVRPADLEAWLAGRGPRVAVPEAPSTPTGAFERGPYPYADVAGRSSIAAEPGTLPSRADLEAILAGVDELVARRLRLVALLTKAVVALGWSAPVIVGGCAVQYYTSGNYSTIDIDLVGASEPVAQVLESWGFLREGRHWYDAELKFAIEVPGGQLDPHEAARVFGVRVEGVTAYIIGIEDLIIDRLNACVHWKDAESCRWARVMRLTAPELDEDYLEERAAAEQVQGKLHELRVEP
ncbi:MAG: helix-turn-helix domain-containing protein [Coriobacteriia bacterium]|nr:helix-turn-helix domain-containing protein [Coriobacteriia bacterium]